jgi:hypothetical protein
MDISTVGRGLVLAIVLAAGSAAYAGTTDSSQAPQPLPYATPAAPLPNDGLSTETSYPSTGAQSLSKAPLPDDYPNNNPRALLAQATPAPEKKAEITLKDDSGQPAAEMVPMSPAAAPPQPWHIPQPCLLQQYGVNTSGWIQQGITFNNLRPADRYNGPNVTNDRDREYQLNQFWMTFERPTDTGGCGWDLGGRIDMSYGEDWRFGQSYGLENRFDDPNSFYGLVLPQFYMEVAIDDLKIKMGHFATFTSYEVVPAPPNFFYSHTYLSMGYFDPVLVTGLQADYKLNDNWNLIGGINRGWMMFEDPTNSWNFLGGGKWTSDDKKHTLSLMVDTGPQTGFTGLRSRYSVFAVYTRQFTEKLLYASQYSTGQEVNGSFVVPGANDNWFGTEQMFIRKLNDEWSAAVRYEWVHDDGGARMAGIGNALLTDRGWDGLPGFTGHFHDVSLGVNYRPNLNFVLRPEVRWDAYDGPRNPAGQLPYGNHERSSQFTFATDLIFTY